jgi:hypothetical protein
VGTTLQNLYSSFKDAIYKPARFVYLPAPVSLHLTLQGLRFSYTNVAVAVDVEQELVDSF